MKRGVFFASIIVSSFVLLGCYATHAPICTRLTAREVPILMGQVALGHVPATGDLQKLFQGHGPRHVQMIGLSRSGLATRAQGDHCKLFQLLRITAEKANR